MVIYSLHEFQAIADEIKDPEHLKQCQQFDTSNQRDLNGKEYQLFKHSKDGLKVQNFVGILPLKDIQLEIYPKIPLADSNDNDDNNKKLFYKMLRHWHGLKFAHLGDAKIKKLSKFPLFELYISLFFDSVKQLVQRGLAHNYIEVADSLTHLKGRLDFPTHIYKSIGNQAQFYCKYDNFTANRAANRLIKKAVKEANPEKTVNKRSRRQLLQMLDAIPIATNISSDWQQYKLHDSDRNMILYQQLMQWVQLLLFNYGLAPFKDNANKASAKAPSLLVPMEQVFEDYISAMLKKNCPTDYSIKLQSPEKSMLKKDDGSKLFKMKPDISIMQGKEVIAIVDAKWKRLSDENTNNYGVSQADIYQLYSYAKLYNCNKVALLYPKNKNFNKCITLEFNEDSKIAIYLYPFDIANSDRSSRRLFSRYLKISIN